MIVLKEKLIEFKPFDIDVREHFFLMIETSLNEYRKIEELKGIIEKIDSYLISVRTISSKDNLTNRDLANIHNIIDSVIKELENGINFLKGIDYFNENDFNIK